MREKRDALLKEDAAHFQLGKLLPDLDPTPEFAWASSFGNTSTGLPLVSPVPANPPVCPDGLWRQRHHLLPHRCRTDPHQSRQGPKDTDAVLLPCEAERW